jgi:hypothetical protein
VLANAWIGGTGGAAGELIPHPGGWAARGRLPGADKFMLPEAPPKLEDWRESRVGWGVVLPDDDTIPEEDRAAGTDAPEPIRRLLRERAGSPVLRFRPESSSYVRRYYTDKKPRDLAIASTPHGTQDEELPMYLLLCGSPETIPWHFQYALNARFAVGRLDLEPEALDRYVDALCTGWSESTVDPRAAVVWATDHGANDISALMKRVIAKRLYDALDNDVRPRSCFVGAVRGDATGEALVDALSRRPGLIVTTSHGATGPIADPNLPSHLGAPVDDGGSVLQPQSLSGLAGGAIWYSHACCSAGATRESIYDGLTTLDSDITRMLGHIATLGSMTAPLARAVLSAPEPARAFVGHVEPTFDWTIRDPDTGQPIGQSIVTALWDRLYQGWPLGYALASHYEPLGALSALHVSLRKEFDTGAAVDARLLRCQLEARDRMSLVILGDPTVALPLH